MVDLHLRRRRRCRTEASALRMGSTKASALDGCGSRAVQSERLTGITCGPTAMQRRACYRRRPPRRFRFRSRRRSHNHRSVSNSMRRLTIPLLLVVFPKCLPLAAPQKPSEAPSGALSVAAGLARIERSSAAPLRLAHPRPRSASTPDPDRHRGVRSANDHRTPGGDCRPRHSSRRSRRMPTSSYPGPSSCLRERTERRWESRVPQGSCIASRGSAWRPASRHGTNRPARPQRLPVSRTDGLRWIVMVVRACGSG
jgi:hypothetical protein